MGKSFRIANNCRICRSTRLYKFLDLGEMPIPNGFRKKEDLSKREENYELACNYCKICGLVQLSTVVHPDNMFKNYVYISGTSRARMSNFSSLAYQAHSRLNLSESSVVYDIGSNDGSLLTFFKAYGCKVVGIDPASNLTSITELNGVPTEVVYFNTNSAKRLKAKHGKADVITATNVIAHIDNLHSVFKGVDVLLKKDGVFITEFPYLVDLMDKLLFDTIYHEHLSYFALKPWSLMVEKMGFEIVDLRRLPIDGGALRLTHKRKSKKRNPAKKTLEYFLKLEEQKGLNKEDTYEVFSKKVNDLKNELNELIDSLKKDKKRIIGYGAPAKGNVLTNFFKIGKNKLDYIVDSTPYKQGLFTPGMNIPVYPESKLEKDMPDYALILAWNFANEIIAKQNAFQSKGGRFIIPLPEVKVI